MTLGIGIHPGIAMEAYLSDNLTPEPALSSSGIRTLLEASPLAFISKNPRLWPFPWEFKEQSTKPQKLGTAVHSLLLGAGQEIRVLDPAEFRNDDGSPSKNLGSKAAKKAKADAEAAGLLTLTKDENRAAVRAAEYAEKKILANRLYGEAWRDGESEVTLLWQRQTSLGPIWCRARADRLNLRAGVIFDPKTTSKSISDNSLARKFASEGTDYQAVWYADGLEKLAPELAGRVRYVPVAIEVEPPFDSRFLRFPESTLTLIAQQIDTACEIFARCLQNDRWPGFDDGRDEAVLPAIEWRERAIYDALCETEASE